MIQAVLHPAQAGWHSLTTLLQRFHFAPRLLVQEYTSFLYFVAAAGFVFACNITMVLGERMVLAKHHIGVIFFLLATTLFSRRISPTNLRRFLLNFKRWRSDIPLFILFWAIIGGNGLVSHGKWYAAMSADFWHFDPLVVLARRITVPGLAHMCGIGAVGYIYFWYIILFASFCLANKFFKERGLLWIERISLLTSSLFAYLFMAPGYVEVFVLLCGLYILIYPTTFAEKIVLAALMFGAHEVAALIIFLPIILESRDRERTEWTTIVVSLVAVYVLGYTYNWRGHVMATLSRAVQPAVDQGLSALDLVLQRPLFSLLAVLVAYKLYWAVILSNWFHTDAKQRMMTLCVLSCIPLVLIACDASRVVQFSTVAMFLIATYQLPQWSLGRRKLLAVANLMVPSFYVGTNCPALWGANGAYSWYLKLGEMLGQNWGTIFT